MARLTNICVTWVLLSIMLTHSVFAVQETSLLLNLPGQNVDQINAANGSCVQYQGSACQAGNFSTTNPIGIKFPALNPPRVKIATTSMSGSQSINQNKGTLSFDYTTLSTEQSDWGKPLNNQARIKTLFKWGDTAQQFQVIIYNDGVKSYLVFRHDATNNCTGSACQRSVSTSRYETGDSKIVMGWKPAEKHQITVSWNFRTPAEGNSSMGIYIDGKYAIVETKSSSINSDGFYQPSMYLGADHQGGNPAQGIIGNFKIYSD